VLSWIAMLGGTVGGGLLGEVIGPRATMMVGAVAALPAVLWLVWSPARSLRRLPTVIPDAEAT
jgi:predicted MFS family arabinose efflux permease